MFLVVVGSISSFPGLVCPGSNEVGRPFSADTALRDPPPPHCGQSDAIAKYLAAVPHPSTLNVSHILARMLRPHSVGSALRTVSAKRRSTVRKITSHSASTTPGLPGRVRRV